MQFARRFLYSLLLAGVLSNAGAAELGVARPESVGMSSQRLARLTSEMKAIADRGDVSGVVTLVAKDGKVVHFEATGKRELETGTPMKKDSIFRIYSMTKPMVGVAMMMLFEQGKWQLNDPVAKYIPEFADMKVAQVNPENGAITQVAQKQPMTMRELMSHTAGFTYGLFGSTAVDKLYLEQNVMDQTQPLSAFIQKVSKVPLLLQPGDKWHYSIAVDIQGYIVEKLSGQSLPDFMQEHIFAPLKMVDTAFYVPAEKLNRFVEFYDRDPAGKMIKHASGDYTKPPVFVSGGGGLVSTATDYLRFCQMMLNDGELDGQRLLSPLTVELMRSNMLPKKARHFDKGVGFGLDLAVVEDPVAAGGYVGKGTYYWGGYAGTWFWIDPVYNVIVIGMIQQQQRQPLPDFRALSRSLTYQAIVEPNKGS